MHSAENLGCIFVFCIYSTTIELQLEDKYKVFIEAQTLVTALTLNELTAINVRPRSVHYALDITKHNSLTST